METPGTAPGSATSILSSHLLPYFPKEHPYCNSYIRKMEGVSYKICKYIAKLADEGIKLFNTDKILEEFRVAYIFMDESGCLGFDFTKSKLLNIFLITFP